jgi:Protein of unknown function (DUF3800)
MAYFFYFDESGTDKHESPYEVLCGVAIKDQDLWQLIQRLKETEEKLFGTRYANSKREIKGRKFLNSKSFRQASWFPPIEEAERTALAKACLENGGKATRKQMSALGQAKLAYIRRVLEICDLFRIKVFASISVENVREVAPDSDAFLRKDYVYVFERMYYYLEEKDVYGAIIFDELEKSQSHILVSQMENYFKKTSKGRQRASLILPEPFFVHSDLTTGIQTADIIAYIISWGFRLPGMIRPARPEMEEFVQLFKPLRYQTKREVDFLPDWQVWSVTFIK